VDGVSVPRSQTPTIASLAGGPGEETASLVARSRTGDTAAFALLYRRHVDRIYAFVARRLNDREAAEDATQEIFARALAGLERCRDDAAFAGWLFAIARNVVSEQYRVRRHGSAPLEDASDPEDPDPTPEEHALRGEDRAELRDARERCLNGKERELFDLLLADLTDIEIAAALGRRRGAIRTAHWRLLIKLRACFGILTRAGRSGHATS
jgi:RNA polymerase sigma-70 factor (ECF subfamily)